MKTDKGKWLPIRTGDKFYPAYEHLTIIKIVWCYTMSRVRII